MRIDIALLGLASCVMLVRTASADDRKSPPAEQTTPATAPAASPTAAPPASGKSDRPPNQILEIRNEWTKVRAADAPPLETADDRGREQVGRLVYSKVTLEFEEVPLRDALRAFRRELGLNMTVFLNDPTGKSERPGFDGDQPIALALREVDGRAALEALLAFAGKEVTWQIHNGVIEVGPRAHLARPDARESRVYDTTDLAIDPPDWKLEKQPDGTYGAVEIQRRNSDEVIGELVKMIVSHCEPEAFVPIPDSVTDEVGRRLPVQHATPAGDGTKRGGSGRRSPNTTATANFDPADGPVFVRGRWASIQMKDNNLAVVAPDFVHRAINGYPRPIPPPAE